jgi:ribonuclease HI
MGGWGALFRYRTVEKKLKGAVTGTTNNRMELMAAIEALRALKVKSRVRLWTDSKYVQQGITQWLPNWKRRDWRTSANQPVKNADLWRLLDEQQRRHDIQWCWVKGHSGDPGNETADALANDAIDNYINGRTGNNRPACDR